MLFQKGMVKGILDLPSALQGVWHAWKSSHTDNVIATVMTGVVAGGLFLGEIGAVKYGARLTHNLLRRIF